MPVTVSSSECLILTRGWGTLEQSELAQLTGTIDGYIARREKFVVVADALDVASVAPAGRQFVGEHRKSVLARASGLDLGLVLAVRSPFVRGAITAISWFGGQFANLRTVETRLELARSARELLAERQVRLSPTADAALDAFVSPRSSMFPGR